MTTAICHPIASSRFHSNMTSLRMGFDSMAAWDRTSVDFEDHIQRRTRASTDPRPVSKVQNRSLPDNYCQPPSFQAATSHWSPPTSPTTAVAAAASSSSSSSLPPRHKSLPVTITITPPQSPRVNAVSGPAVTPPTEDHASLSTKLYAASCEGDLSQVAALLSLGASPNVGIQVKGLYQAFKPAKNGHLSPLAGAATHGQLSVAKLLISHGAAISPSLAQSSSSPLHQACYTDNIEMTRYLLTAGANVNAQNSYKTTPLMYAAKHGTPALVALVLSYQPYLETQAFMECTAAHWAVFHSRPETLALLLSVGANPDARIVDGSTLLHCAAMRGATEMVKLLINYGADTRLRDGESRTPLEVALGNGEDAAVDLLRG